MVAGAGIWAAVGVLTRLLALPSCGAAPSLLLRLSTLFLKQLKLRLLSCVSQFSFAGSAHQGFHREGVRPRAQSHPWRGWRERTLQSFNLSWVREGEGGRAQRTGKGGKAGKSEKPENSENNFWIYIQGEKCVCIIFIYTYRFSLNRQNERRLNWSQSPLESSPLSLFALLPPSGHVRNISPQVPDSRTWQSSETGKRGPFRERTCP